MKYGLQNFNNIERTVEFTVTVMKCKVLEFVPSVEPDPLVYAIFSQQVSFDAMNHFTLRPQCVYDEKEFSLQVTPTA